MNIRDVSEVLLGFQETTSIRTVARYNSSLSDKNMKNDQQMLPFHPKILYKQYGRTKKNYNVKMQLIRSCVRCKSTNEGKMFVLWSSLNQPIIAKQYKQSIKNKIYQPSLFRMPNFECFLSIFTRKLPLVKISNPGSSAYRP